MRDFWILLKELMRLFVEEGIPMNARLLLEEMSEVSALKGTVYYIMKLSSGWCFAIAAVFAVLVLASGWAGMKLIGGNHTIKSRTATMLLLLVCLLLAAFGFTAIVFASAGIVV